MPRQEYYLRKAEGICVRCGNKQAVTGKAMCEDCLESERKRSAERRNWLKSMGYCPICGREKLIGDEKRCPECLAKAYASNVKYLERNPLVNKMGYVARKQVLDDKGLCRQCGKRQRAAGKTYCEHCLSKKREQVRKKYKQNDIPRSERYGYGLCYRCGKPLDSDKRLCKSCCEKAALNFGKKTPNESNHPWKRDNQLLKREVVAI